MLCDTCKHKSLCDFSAYPREECAFYNTILPRSYNSFGEYLATLPPDTIFRLWEYKRMFTPYEQEEKFSDESLYVDDECKFVCIKDVIILPDGDLLLAISPLDLDGYVAYHKLSDISLAKADKDMEEEE